MWVHRPANRHFLRDPPLGCRITNPYPKITPHLNVLRLLIYEHWLTGRKVCSGRSIPGLLMAGWNIGQGEEVPAAGGDSANSQGTHISHTWCFPGDAAIYKVRYFWKPGYFWFGFAMRSTSAGRTSADRCRCYFAERQAVSPVSVILLPPLLLFNKWSTASLPFRTEWTTGLRSSHGSSRELGRAGGPSAAETPIGYVDTSAFLLRHQQLSWLHPEPWRTVLGVMLQETVCQVPLWLCSEGHPFQDTRYFLESWEKEGPGRKFLEGTSFTSAGV